MCGQCALCVVLAAAMELLIEAQSAKAACEWEKGAGGKADCSGGSWTAVRRSVEMNLCTVMRLVLS